MARTQLDKNNIKQKLVACLSGAAEIEKIVIFGSFLIASEPNDLDVAVFQTSDQGYLPLALRYRKMVRSIANDIAVDILPIKAGVANSVMLDSITQGEVIFER